MKARILLAIIGAAVMLTACGKTDLEKKIEHDEAVSKKMGGDVSTMPRVLVTPDNNRKKGGQ